MIMDDPDLRPLALDLVASIECYLHRKLKISRPHRGIQDEGDPAAGEQHGSPIAPIHIPTGPGLLVDSKPLELPEEPAA